MNIRIVAILILLFIAVYISRWIVRYNKRIISGEICKNCVKYNCNDKRCCIRPKSHDIASECFCNKFERRVSSFDFCKKCKHYNLRLGYCRASGRYITGLSHYYCHSFDRKEEK